MTYSPILFDSIQEGICLLF